MRFATVDPGSKNIGFAFWRDGRLLRAGGCAPADFAAAAIDEIVIERPFVYPKGAKRNPDGTRRVVDPNDQITLALSAGTVAGIALSTAPGCKVVWLKPAEWKHQLPKSVCHERAHAALSEEELLRIEWPTSKKDRLDVWDAIAMGLARLRRVA